MALESGEWFESGSEAEELVRWTVACFKDGTTEGDAMVGVREEARGVSEGDRRELMSMMARTWGG